MKISGSIKLHDCNAVILLRAVQAEFKFQGYLLGSKTAMNCNVKSLLDLYINKLMMQMSSTGVEQVFCILRYH